jgi:hypothetical protein
LFRHKRRDDVGGPLYRALIVRDDLLRRLPHPLQDLRIVKEIPQCAQKVLLILHHSAAMRLR